MDGSLRVVAQSPLKQFGDGFARRFRQKVGKEALSANQDFFVVNSWRGVAAPNPTVRARRASFGFASFRIVEKRFLSSEERPFLLSSDKSREKRFGQQPVNN